MPRKDSAMLAEIKSWGKDPENRMKKCERPKWNPTNRADVVRDRLAENLKIRKEKNAIKGKGLDEHGMITFDMEDCRKFLNKVDKRAADSQLYNGFDAMHPAKISSTEYWQRWMVCTPPENVDRPVRPLTGTMKKEKAKKKLNRVVKGLKRTMLLSAFKHVDGGKGDSDGEDGDLFANVEYDEDVGNLKGGEESEANENKNQADIDLERKEMEEQLAKNADHEAEARQQQLNKEAKTMEDYWRCLHPIDALKDDYGKLRSKDEELPVCEECEKCTSHCVCQECEQFFCDLCWPKVHSRGALRFHKRSRVSAEDKTIQRVLKREICGTGGRGQFFFHGRNILSHNTTIKEDSEDEKVAPSTPRTAYIRQCKLEKIIPEPTICRTEQSKTFSRAFFGLGNQKTRAALNYLSNLPPTVTILNLSDNRLDDKTLAEVIKALANNTQLEKIILRGNKFGMKSADAMADFLTLAKKLNLEHLDVSHCNIGDNASKLLATALQKTKSPIQELHLEHNRIGEDGAKALGNAFSKHRTLEKVFLQWNPFGDSGGVYIAKSIRTNSSITHLDLHMTGFADSASKVMGSSLKFNKVLKWLNLSHNPISDVGAQTLADGLKRNETLETLNLNHIIGGSKGAKALIKSIENMSGDVQRNIQMEGMDHALKKFQEFNAKNPSGRYALDLSVPYEREIAMALLRLSGDNRNLLWSDVQLDGIASSQKNVTKMHRGKYKLPRNGIFEFKIDISGEGRLPDAEEIKSATEDLLDRLKGVSGIKRLQILASTEGMFLDKENAEKILALFPENGRVTAMLTILPKLVDHDAALELVEKFLTPEQQIELDNKMGMIFGFCPINPTGRYKLDLNDHYQRLVVERCMNISKDEHEWADHIGVGDTSQHGNGTGFRNEMRNGRKMIFKHGQVFAHNGIVHFDFVSRVRPLPDNNPMPEELFQKMIGSMGFQKRETEAANSAAAGSLMATIAAKKAAKKWKKKVKNNTSTEAVMAAKAKQKADSKNIKAVLNGLVYTADGRIIRRGVGLGHADSIIMKMREYIAEYQVYFECEQLEYLLSVLPPKKPSEKYHTLKVEMITALFARIVDMEHFSWMVMHNLEANDKKEVIRRLGVLNVFDPHHPQGDYVLNLEKGEHRKLARMLASLVTHEPDFAWVDGTYNGFPFDMPPSWTRRVPKTGRVTMTITNTPGGGLHENEWDNSTRIHYKEYIENMDISYLDKEDEIRVARLRKKLERCKKALENDTDSYYYQQMEYKIRNDIAKITHRRKYNRKQHAKYGRTLNEKATKNVLHHVLVGTHQHYENHDIDDLIMIKNSRTRHSMLNIKVPEKGNRKEGGKEMVFVFQPEQSVFADRIEEADSGSYYDDEVLRDMLNCDFERMQEQEVVRNFISRRHKDGQYFGDEQNTRGLLNQVLDELMAHRAHIYNTFDFYAVMGSGSDITQIQLNQFTDLLDDCNIPDKNSVTCNRAALDRIFISTNREDDQDDATAEANDDSSLMRFEFIEIFIRIAIAKYVESGDMDDVVVAVRKLMAEHFASNKGEGSCNALIDDATKFRKSHVYQEETDDVLRENMGFLKKIFKGYCRDDYRGMIVKEYIAMLRDMDFLNSDFTQREAKLAFVWSKTRVIDEVANRNKIWFMSFFDFLESLTRLSQLKNMPSNEDLQRMATMRVIKLPTYLAYLKASVGAKQNKLIHRPSNDWGAPPTRPISVKLKICIDMMRAACDRLNGVTKKFHL